MLGSSKTPDRGAINGWLLIGWIFLVALGIGLVFFGFALPKGGERSSQVSPTPTLTSMWNLTPLAPTTPTPLLILPTNTPEPTVIPPTPTQALPMITAGAQGVNVRSGPGVNFSILGRLDPGVQASVIGRYSNWWQILYNGNPAWVSGDVVTAANVEAVPQVQPPPSPIPPTPLPPTATPTAVPPTVSSTRGLVGGSFIVSNKTRSTRGQAGTVFAPGPYALNTPLWCDWQVSNTSTTPLSYASLGPWVEEANYHKKSWTGTTLQPGQAFGLNWEDHIEIGAAGTYHIWLRICFTDGVCANLAGPVTVTIQ